MDTVGNKCFEVESYFTNFYSGNKVVWTGDGQYLYCQKADEVHIVSVATGRKVGCVSLDDGTDEIDKLLTFDLSKEDLLISAHASGLLKLWNLGSFIQVAKWKCNHLGPILDVQFSPSDNICGSVGTDFTIRIWDCRNLCCICKIKEKGKVSTICFYPDIYTSKIFVAGHDNIIRCWNYSCKQHSNSFKGHISPITAIEVDERDLKLMASVSVDKTLILWNLIEGIKVNIIPLYESLCGVFFVTSSSITVSERKLSNDKDAFVIAVGISGSIYLLNCFDVKVLYTQPNAIFDAQNPLPNAVTKLLQCKQIRQFAVVTSNHSISFFDLSTLKCLKQLTGFNVILDICFLGDRNQCLVLATNNSAVNVYETSTMNCVVALGHLDQVLTITALKNYLLSAGKDMNILIWKLHPELFSITCIGKCTGHTAPIESICFSNNYLLTFASVSQDGILKLWNISELKDINAENNFKISLKNSVGAHNKGINCVAFSPNNIVIATASQDRSIKVWKGQNLSAVATLRGHRRGVCIVRFSPSNQILISSSKDCSIRLWSLSTLECLSKIDTKCPVLCLEFLSQGDLFISADTEGIIKIWNLKSTTSLLTLDKHKNVLAIAVYPNGKGFYSGGSNADLIFWKDVTDKITNLYNDNKVVKNRQYQIFNDLNKAEQSEAAFRLAITLKKPYSLFRIIRNIIKNSRCLNRNPLLEEPENNLHLLQKLWNTNARFCKVCQSILDTVICVTVAERTRICSHYIVPKYIHQYTECHYKRICFYIKQLKYLDFVVNCI